MPSRRAKKAALEHDAGGTKNVAVDVLIPAYRGLAETRQCIESVLGSRQRQSFELVVVDDASPEPELAAYLDGLAANSAITLIRNESNLGFVQSVNRGMRLHATRDVVLLNSDTMVANDWLDRLRACAYREPNIGTVTPFSNNATICSYPVFCAENPLPSGVQLAELDRICSHVNRGKSVEIPTAVGFCMYVRRACLDQIGLFDADRFGKGYGEENDFSRRAVRAGWINLLCADTFVYHVGAISFQSERSEHQARGGRALLQLHPDYDDLVRGFIAADPVKPLRRAIDAALAGLPPPILSADNESEKSVNEQKHNNVVCIYAGANTLEFLDATVRSVAGNSVACSKILVAVPTAEPGDRAPVESIQAGGRIPIELIEGDGGFEQALEQSKQSDGLVLVAAGIAVPFAWDARLAKVAAADARIGSVSPLCDAATGLSPLERKSEVPLTAHDMDRIDRLVYCLGSRSYFEIGNFFQGCFYLPRKVLDVAARISAGIHTMPDQLARILAEAGYLHAVTDSVCVCGQPDAAISANSARNDIDPRLLHLRKRVTDAFYAGADFKSLPGLDAKPVQLHVTHDLGGGAIQWIKDFDSVDNDRINLVLKPFSRSHAFGEGIALYLSLDDSRPLMLQQFALPIQSTAATHLEYRQALEQIVKTYCVDAILVSSLVGHSLDILDTGLPTAFICHDYYPYCPAINLYFGGVCTSCDENRLKECHDKNHDFNPFLKFSYPERSLVRRRFLELIEARNITMVAPTRSVRDNLVRLQGRFGNVRFETIGHGSVSNFSPLDLPAPAPDEKLRVLVLGQLSLGKGSGLLLDAIERLTGFAEVFLIGTGEVGELFRNMPGVHPVTSYQRDQLPEILQNVRPDLGLLLSIVSETFSYTLTELMQLGIPVVATNVGSFKERIKHGETGFLFEPTPDALLQTLRDLNGNKSILLEIRANLASLAVRTEQAMVEDYHRVLPLQAKPYAHYRLNRGAESAAPASGVEQDELKLSQALMLADAWKQIRQLNLMLTLKEDVLRRGEWKGNRIEQDLAYKAGLLEQKDLQLNQKIQELEQSSQQLQQKDQVLEHKDRLLEHKDNLIEHRDQQLQHKNQLLQRREEELRQQDHAIEQRDQQLAKTHQMIEQQSRQLAEGGKLLERKDKQLTQSESLLEQRTREFQESSRQLQEISRQLADASAQLAERGRQLQYRDQIIQAREAQLSEVYASTSWKLSRPVRWIGFCERKIKILAHSLWKPVICNPRHAPAILAECYRVWRKSGMLALKLHLVRLPEMGRVGKALEDARPEFALTIKPEILLRIEKMPHRPLISILMPTYNTPEAMLRETIQSVLAQLYPKWELCIADDCSTQPHVKDVLREYAARDSRIKLHFGRENHGVSHASNQALRLAKGEYTVLLDHDDGLEEQAIFRVAECACAEQPDLLYSDEVLLSGDGSAVLGYAFRPAFSPELLRSHPYIVHLVGFKTRLLREVGGFDESLSISQDYDLILRVAEKARKIVHIPEILYRWRTHQGSAGHQKMAQVMQASKSILQRHLQRCGEHGNVMDGPSFNFFDTRYPIEPASRVAIIIPTKNYGAMVKQCIDSIERTVKSVPYDIVLIDHASDDPESVAYFESLKEKIQVLRYEGPFNFSAINNWAISKLTRRYTHYLLCNNDIEAIEPGWLERLMELAQRPSVGMVGAMLYYPDGKTIQHAGVCVGAYGIAEHYGKFMRMPDQGLEPGYIGSLIVNREVAAVTAACALIKKEVFDEIEGFDEKLAVGFGDVDLCLKVISKGHRILFCPYSKLIHHESLTRGKSTQDPHPEDSAYFLKKWKRWLENGDPYFNPNLSLFSTAWHVKLPMTHEINLRRRVYSPAEAKARQLIGWSEPAAIE